MSIKWRIITGFFILYAIGFYLLYDFIANDIRPRYLETVEESLNDTANILASLIEQEIENSVINVNTIKPVIRKAYEKKISSRIYALHKTGVSLQVYITDQNGIIIYSSNELIKEGEDYSKWRDVRLTLLGKYGARSSLLNENDPKSKSIFVAAPVKYKDKIAGVITVIKPEESISLFIEIAKRRALVTGILTCMLFIFLSFVLSIWISRPVNRLTEYVKSLRENKRAEMPSFAGREITTLAETFNEVWEDLKGEKYIEQYIQTLTHELKSPLSSIIGSSELLEDDLPDEQKRIFHKNIFRESRRMESIIQRMLELSSIESQDRLRNIGESDIVPMINDILESLYPEYHKKNITIKKNTPQSLAIECDEFLVRHAIQNLVQNAVRFSADNDTITISAAMIDNHISVTITDNGEGIPDYAADKIFNKFYSLPSQGTKVKSTGLGLPFVKEIAALHRGSITVINNPDKGVTAELTLPVEQNMPGL
jgi:two-component system sensor histidine kinase CreC